METLGFLPMHRHAREGLITIFVYLVIKLTDDRPDQHHALLKI